MQQENDYTFKSRSYYKYFKRPFLLRLYGKQFPPALYEKYDSSFPETVVCWEVEEKFDYPKHCVNYLWCLLPSSGRIRSLQSSVTIKNELENLHTTSFVKHFPQHMTTI